MDFGQHQVKAKNRTFLLVCLYGLGLLGLTIVAVIAAVIITGGGADGGVLIVLCLVGVPVLVIGGTLFKSAQLSMGGGRAVAESIGGRQVSPSTTDPAERRFYSIVEDMARSIGTPMPTVYVIDEPSINAFAAGLSPKDAHIASTRGTLDLLTHDELKGVMAHEFSHILNGDMRMNLRLIGILFGLQLLATTGYYWMFFAGHTTSNRGKNNVAALVGGLLMVVGFVGIFFSAIIKAAISRQREFLADASAVQYTSNPAGIAGALIKIGSPGIGSDVPNKRAAEASHLFFGDVCNFFSLGGLLATHPNITARIKRIDPSFDGKFPEQVKSV
jgi:Zn-dependent protease with chaperone function